MNRKQARRSTPKGRGGSSGGGHSRDITEEQHDEAVRVLRAEYYQGVRGIAAELAQRVKDGDIKSQDDWESAIHQAVDGSYWVIYTHANFQVLFLSDNHDAYSEDFGEPPISDGSINWAALAFAAMDRDVRQQINAEEIEPDWSRLEETRRLPPRRGPPPNDRRRGPRPGPHARRR